MIDRWHVFQFMTRNPYCAHPETTLRELTTHLVERRATAAPVINQEGEIVGLVSLSDVAVDAVVQPPEAKGRLVRDVMQRRVYTVDQAATVPPAVEELKKHRVHRLVVTDHDRVVGVVSCLDLLDSVLEKTGFPPIA